MYRGFRVLKSRIPKRPSLDNSTLQELVADSMLIQMAFHMIPADIYTNEDGELLDNGETVLWEGEIYRRVRPME